MLMLPQYTETFEVEWITVFLLVGGVALTGIGLVLCAAELAIFAEAYRLGLIVGRIQKGFSLLKRKHW